MFELLAEFIQIIIAPVPAPDLTGDAGPQAIPPPKP